jgi:hypothetical protein
VYVNGVADAGVEHWNAIRLIAIDKGNMSE